MKKQSYLPYEDYVENAPSEAGAQVHTNHSNCTAGIDTKQRLYIKRSNDGNTILAYCHNCCQSGYYMESFARFRKAISGKSGTSGESKDVSFGLPRDIQASPEDFPVAAKGWLYKHGLTDTQLRRHGVGYSPSLGRIVLPVYRDGELVKYQTRKVFEHDTKPKYLTYKKKERAWFSEPICSTDLLVIVEDILSGIRVAEQFPCLALLSSGISESEVLFIVKNFNNVLIWLDNDNRQVKLSQVEIKNKLDNLVRNVIIVHEKAEPKYYSDKDIAKVVYDYASTF